MVTVSDLMVQLRLNAEEYRAGMEASIAQTGDLSEAIGVLSRSLDQMSDTQNDTQQVMGTTSSATGDVTAAMGSLTGAVGQATGSLGPLANDMATVTDAMISLVRLGGHTQTVIVSLAAAVVAASAAFYLLGNSAMSYYSSLSRVSAQTGLSLDETDRWGVALSVVGGNMESLRLITMRLTSALDDQAAGGTTRAAQALRDLGVGAIDPLTGQMRSVNDALTDTIRRLSELSAEKQHSEEIKIFGRALGEVAPLVANLGRVTEATNRIMGIGGDTTRNAQARMIEYGAVMTAFHEILISIATGVAPLFIRFTQALLAGILSFKTAVENTIDIVARHRDALVALAAAGAVLAGVLAALVIVALAPVVAAIGGAVAAAAPFIAVFAALTAAVTAAYLHLDDLRRLWDALVVKARELWARLAELRPAFEAVAAVVAVVLAVALLPLLLQIAGLIIVGKEFIEHLDDIKAAFHEAWGAIVQFFHRAVAEIGRGLDWIMDRVGVVLAWIGEQLDKLARVEVFGQRPFEAVESVAEALMSVLSRGKDRALDFAETAVIAAIIAGSALKDKVGSGAEAALEKLKELRGALGDLFDTSGLGPGEVPGLPPSVPVTPPEPPEAGVRTFEETERVKAFITGGVEMLEAFERFQAGMDAMWSEVVARAREAGVALTAEDKVGWETRFTNGRTYIDNILALQKQAEEDRVRLVQQTVQAVDRLEAGLVSALQARARAQHELVISTLREQRRAFEEAERVKRELAQETHERAVRLLETQTALTVAGLRKQIDALRVSEAVDQLKQVRDQLKLAYDPAQAAELQRQIVQLQRQEQVRGLEDQVTLAQAASKTAIQALRDGYDARRKLEEQHLRNIQRDNAQAVDAATVAYGVATDAFRIQSEARRLIMAGEIAQMASLLGEWARTANVDGETLGKQMVLGLKASGLEAYLQALANTVRTLAGPPPSPAPTPPPPPPPPTPSPTGGIVWNPTTGQYERAAQGTPVVKVYIGETEVTQLVVRAISEELTVGALQAGVAGGA